MDSLFHFLETLVLCITGVIVASMVLVVVVMNMKSNPLRDVLISLLWRLGATTGFAVFAAPMQPIPVVDVTYDLGGTILLVVFWLGFFKDVAVAIRGKRESGRSMAKTVLPHHREMG